MSYRENRDVILPNGLRVTEVRTLDDEQITYHYEIDGLLLPCFLHNCPVEYNGQILDAREPEHE